MPKGVVDRRHPDIRFTSYANPQDGDGCWEWTGPRFRRGYGRLGEGVYSHRYAWEFYFGEIPAGGVICHRCDNPPCVNPAHLFLGTQFDNMRDKIAKGRKGKLHKNDDEPCPKGHTFSFHRELRKAYKGKYYWVRTCTICYPMPANPRGHNKLRELYERAS